MSNLYPVLLAGGSGTRLWPISRTSYPKQFSKFFSDQSLFQKSALRLTTTEILKFQKPTTLTSSDFRFIVAEQLHEVGQDPGAILIEPEAKNTGPAILAASIFLHSKDKDATLLVAPCDHLIPDQLEFQRTISLGLTQVENGKFVTFGIKPTRPETGYGYLELINNVLNNSEAQDVLKFTEKPNSEKANIMYHAGNFLWNAGIFLFKASDMIESFHLHAPETMQAVKVAIDEGHTDLGFFRLGPDKWSEIKDISIDYAIMEKASNLVAIPYASKWSDLGDWDAVWSESLKDEFQNVVSDSANAINCKSSLLHSVSENQQIVGLGLTDIMAIATPDAVLVAHKSRVQDVKKVVDALRLRKVAQADTFPKDYRPWGWFEVIAHDSCFQVKRIYVKPGGALSLQSHNYRSEHWVVVEGEAKVTIDDDVRMLAAGESVYVPLGAVHRMENLGASPMILIEVQIGSYLGEDDILRYEDIYARN